MQAPQLIIPGVVRNGVVVPSEPNQLPEGAHVQIVLSFEDIPPDIRAEFDDWERVGDEAWRLIDQWEKEDHS